MTTPALDAVDDGGTAMLRMVQALFLSSGSNVPAQVVFCGVGRENGSTRVCAGAAKTLATNSSRSVCIVDANSRLSLLTHTFGVGADVLPLRTSASLRDQCVHVGENLWLTRTNLLTGEAGGVPSSAALKQTFAALREIFDFVLIDAPGPDVSAEAVLLGQVADGTILVVDADSTRKISARKAKETLVAAKVRLLGSVLNNRSFLIPKGLYDRL